MMQTPLTMPQMIERAEKYFPKKKVVSRTDFCWEILEDDP